jgi:hypothetical protein
MSIATATEAQENSTGDSPENDINAAIILAEDEFYSDLTRRLD